MTGSQVWLAQATYERLRTELTELLRQRGAASRPDSDPMSGRGDSDQDAGQRILADRRDREHRIRTLQELLLNPMVGEAPPDDGVAEPGMLLTVRYHEDDETETFLLAHREENGRDIEICSPHSPLGRAVSGAREGATCEYRRPDGQFRQVTLERAVPYDEQHSPGLPHGSR